MQLQQQVKNKQKQAKTKAYSIQQLKSEIEYFYKQMESLLPQKEEVKTNQEDSTNMTS